MHMKMSSAKVAAILSRPQYHSVGTVTIFAATTVTDNLRMVTDYSSNE